MKKLIIATAALLISMPALAADESTGADTTSEETETTSTGSTVTNFAVKQYLTAYGLYTRESAIKTNTIAIEGADVSGMHLIQSTNMSGGNIVNSKLDVNTIKIYGGKLSSTSVHQYATLDGAVIHNATVELNKVEIR